MKRSFFYTLLIVLIATISGCNDDNSDGVYPDYAARYLGTWHVSDSQQRLNYDVTITRYENSNSRVVLSNFAALGNNVYAMVTEQVIIIEEQELENYTVEGSGSYVNSSKLSIGYTLSDGIDEELRSAIFTK